MNKKLSLATFKKGLATGSKVQGPDGREEIFLYWGKIGAWITSGGMDGKKQFVPTSTLYDRNVGT